MPRNEGFSSLPAIRIERSMMARLLNWILFTALVTVFGALILFRYDTEEFDAQITLVPKIDGLRIRASIPEALDRKDNIIRILHRDEILRKLTEGVGPCEVRGRKESWFKVETSQGEHGWVAGWYVTAASFQIVNGRRIIHRTAYQDYITESRVWCTRHPLRVTAIALFLTLLGTMATIFSIGHRAKSPSSQLVTSTPPSSNTPPRLPPLIRGRARPTNSGTFWIPSSDTDSEKKT